MLVSRYFSEGFSYFNLIDYLSWYFRILRRFLWRNFFCFTQHNFTIPITIVNLVVSILHHSFHFYFRSSNPLNRLYKFYKINRIHFFAIVLLTTRFVNLKTNKFVICIGYFICILHKNIELRWIYMFKVLSVLEF